MINNQRTSKNKNSQTTNKPSKWQTQLFFWAGNSFTLLLNGTWEHGHGSQVVSNWWPILGGSKRNQPTNSEASIAFPASSGRWGSQLKQEYHIGVLVSEIAPKDGSPFKLTEIVPLAKLTAFLYANFKHLAKRKITINQTTRQSKDNHRQPDLPRFN